ncbi:MAG: phnA protein [Proteobacteria bacterium]|jgi:protein PhnA|nr:phnA protein [Pseudomonadota bacterium]
MARGHDRHQAHQAALIGLGRNLSRRARSACELCEERTSLRPFEVEGGPEIPEEDWAAMLCHRCAGVIEDKRLRDVHELRFLENTIWAEVRPVQILAVRLVKRLSEADVHWATELLENLYLDPEVEELI